MINILGGGWYGCHIANHLINKGYEIKLYEKSDKLFSGASGNNQSRLHLGFHYPRSYETRKSCQENYREFINIYGHLTKNIPINIYAIAKENSLVDFGNYVKCLEDEVDFIVIEDPNEYGLKNVEGAILTGERLICIDKARNYFTEKLHKYVEYNSTSNDLDGLLIDCTFCANDSESVDRYEPCIMAIIDLVSADLFNNIAITIMDGMFPSLYPYKFNQATLTSAAFTPLGKFNEYNYAKDILYNMTYKDYMNRCYSMIDQMSKYYDMKDFRIIDYKTSIRAMPSSAADSRIPSVYFKDDKIVVMAGKIDAIFKVARQVEDIVNDSSYRI